MAEQQHAAGDDLIKLKVRNRSDRLLGLIDCNAPWPVISDACWLLRRAIHEADGRWGVSSDAAMREVEEEDTPNG